MGFRHELEACFHAERGPWGDRSRRRAYGQAWGCFTPLLKRVRGQPSFPCRIPLLPLPPCPRARGGTGRGPRRSRSRRGRWRKKLTRTRLPVPVTVRSILVTIPSDRKRRAQNLNTSRCRGAKRTTNSHEHSATDANCRRRMTRWLAGLRNGLKSCVRAQSSVASSPRAASPHQGDT